MTDEAATFLNVERTDRSSGRWSVAVGFAAALIVYLAIYQTLDDARSAAVLNNVAWILAAATACLCSLSAARSLRDLERRSWALIAVGCGMWLAGQLTWTYYELAVGAVPSYPHWMQILFLGIPSH